MKKIELSNLSELFFKNIDKIGKLSKLYRILLCLGILAALIGPFFYFSFLPKLNTIDELKKENESLETRLVRARAKAGQLKHFQAKLKEAEIEFKIVRKKNFLKEKKYRLCCQVFQGLAGMPVWNLFCFSPSLNETKISMLKFRYRLW